MEERLFHSVRTGRISEQIVEQLQAAIFSGRLKPGDRLPTERELAEQFQASRASVREATRTLELFGLVDIRPGAGGGAHVSAPNFDLVSTTLRTMLHANRFDLRELYEARLLLEPGIAELAARLAGEQDLQLLRDALKAARGLLTGQSGTARASYNFHFLLAKVAKNNFLLMLMSSLLDLVHQFDRQGSAPQRSPFAMVLAHEGILDAIERHDSAEAKRRATEHLLELQEQAVAENSAATKPNGQKGRKPHDDVVAQHL